MERQFGWKATRVAGLAIGASLAWRSSARAVPLDKDGDIKLGLRTYVNARIQTEHTDRNFVFEPTDRNQPISNGQPGQPPQNLPLEVQESQTFPYSPPGHLRQNRFYIEAELDHNLDRLRKSFGPLPLLNDLPFAVDDLKYHLTYRGEAEGVYNWGPQEFRGSDSYRQLLATSGAEWTTVPGPADVSNVTQVVNPPGTCTLSTCPSIPEARKELRHKSTVLNRLFQAYVEASINRDLFLRVGRQILVWGETDAFRLLDNINPVDSSFGGFLVSLDERRIPLDMVRASYRLGEYQDIISEATIEGFFSWDNKVSYYPGSAAGSPWTLPNLGAPQSTTYNYLIRPPYNFQSGRGGGRLSWNAFDATFSLAHYYTYDDLPLLKVCVGPGFPLQRITTVGLGPTGGSGPIEGCPIAPTNLPINQPPGANPNNFAILAPQAFAVQQPAKTQISGFTTTFNVPSTMSRALGLSGEPVVRSEIAYIKDGPYYRQSTSDPFIFHTNGEFLNVSGNERRDSINFVLGLDTNQFITWLNATNSFFITTQFFYKHIKGADVDSVLPVPSRNVAPTGNRNLGAVEPDFVANYANQYLQTLLISTSYASGQVNPSATIFYDWSGAFVFVPSVTLVRDPFRFTVEYNYIEAGSLKGNSGVSLVRDRDNLLFQFEYVL